MDAAILVNDIAARFGMYGCELESPKISWSKGTSPGSIRGVSGSRYRICKLSFSGSIRKLSVLNIGYFFLLRIFIVDRTRCDHFARWSS